MEAATDRELWQRARSGDTGAFGTLFERHGRTIYNYCFRRTADWATAEDLASVVFLEAWRKRNEVRLDADTALPWLFGVATNVLRNSRRARGRHRAALERLPREQGQDFADEAAARIDDERRMHRVIARVRKLPLRDQDVLALCVWSGLSYEQAALALELPVGTVRSRLARARKRLRDEAGDTELPFLISPEEARVE